MSGRNGRSQSYELKDVPPAVQAVFVLGWNDFLAGNGFPPGYEAAHHDWQVVYESGRLQSANTVAAYPGRRVEICDRASLRLADRFGIRAAAKLGYPVPPDMEAA